MTPQIVIQKERYYGGKSRKTGRQLTGWRLRYDDDDGGFHCHGAYGGITEAKKYARILQAKLKTNPTIKIGD